MSLLMLGTTLLASTAGGPPHGDGGVSAFYIWTDTVPGIPGTLLRQEPVPEHLVLANAAKGDGVRSALTAFPSWRMPSSSSGSRRARMPRWPPRGWLLHTPRP